MADATRLETFLNPHPDRDYLIEHHVHEFTSMCPKTGQPDFATIKITYIAAATCIELKSLKLYLQGYRAEGIYYEDVTNVILNDLVASCAPAWMLVRPMIELWRIRAGRRLAHTRAGSG